jgi:alkanesulfonate monooxygenase SsuD/methylene tetrahydromethanopterin reductase-like flavin-dependent oxidoreductase (luciferase family)
MGARDAGLERDGALWLEGEHYQDRYVSIWPRPIQVPLPPVFISGSSKESAEFAARRRIGLGLAFTNLAAAQTCCAVLLRAGRRAGLGTSSRPGRVRPFARGSQPPASLEKQLELGMLLCGRPSTVLGQLRHIRTELRAGVISLNFETGADNIETEAAMRRFASGVLPAMHEL